MALILEVLERAFDSKVQISEMFTNCTAQIFLGAPPLFVFYSPLLAKTGCKTLTCPYIEELGSVKRMQGIYALYHTHTFENMIVIRQSGYNYTSYHVHTLKQSGHYRGFQDSH